MAAYKKLYAAITLKNKIKILSLYFARVYGESEIFYLLFFDFCVMFCVENQKSKTKLLRRLL